MTSALRTSAMAACIVLSALYVWMAVRTFQAARLASSLDVASLQRALDLEPREAANQDLLCRLLMFDRQSPAAALPFCRRATALNPYNSTYWLDLALASYSSGQKHEQEEAIRNAVRVDPMTPDVAWSAANFFLAQGNSSDAAQQLSTAMRGDPNLVQPGLELLWRTSHDPSAIQAMLPSRAPAYLQFIRLLVASNQWDAAHRAWSAMMQLHQPVDYDKASIYLDALLQRHEVAKANQAWEQLLLSSPGLASYKRVDNLIVDGGFEQPMLNSGFSWRYSPQSSSVISQDIDASHSGLQSLRVSFNGAGGDVGLLQYVPVQPNTKYTLSAWVKSRQLDAANGPVIAIADSYTGNLLARTRETLGTTEWHPVQSDFATGPNTELVSIRIIRDPGATHIKGRFWVDDVSLRPAP